MLKKNKNIPALLKRLKQAYPQATCALDHANPVELLVATILSAQCTDKRVNLVTKTLFKKFRTLKDYANAPQADLEKEIHSTGFYRNKAKSIRGMARMLLENYNGTVPGTMEELLKLPGVARKTANVVLGTSFGIAEGIVVDTHVSRLSQRLGLSAHQSPEKIEKDLMAVVPKGDWIWFSHALINHGRQVCSARAPQCPQCPLRRECPNPVG